MCIEKINTLEQIHLAIESVENARSVPGLSTEQEIELERASVKLWNLEQSIIRKTGNDLIKSLIADSKALRDLTVKIKQSGQLLEDVAEVVEKVSKVVETLLKILATAGGAGLT